VKATIVASDARIASVARKSAGQERVINRQTTRAVMNSAPDHQHLSKPGRSLALGNRVLAWSIGLKCRARHLIRLESPFMKERIEPFGRCTYRMLVATRILVAAFTLFIAAASTQAQAENDAGCTAVARFGVYDKFQTFTPDTQYQLILAFFANNPFYSRRDVERQRDVVGVEFGEVLGLQPRGKRSETEYVDWAEALIHTSYREALRLGLKPETVAKASDALMTRFPTCLATKGLHAYLIPAADKETFSFIAEFIGPDAAKPVANGLITMGPETVADTCEPRGIVGKGIDLGRQGVSLSCRLPADSTLTISTKANGKTQIIFYDGHLPPVDDQQ
jgi:hypothetical protein